MYNMLALFLEHGQGSLSILHVVAYCHRASIFNDRLIKSPLEEITVTAEQNVNDAPAIGPRGRKAFL